MIKIPLTYNGKPLKASWTYRTKEGSAFGHVGRYQNDTEKKDIVPFFKRNGTGWAAGIELTPRPLYGLDMLASHDRTKALFIVEGEKAAAALQSMGVTAVTSLGGSQSTGKADWTPLNGYKMAYLLPEMDEPGEHYIKDVYTALMALQQAPAVKVLRLNGLQEGGDIVDWLQNHAPDWDGLKPFPEQEKAWARSELQTLLKTAEPVPEEWSLVGSVGAGCGDLWEKPNEIETKTPAVMTLSTELIPEPFRPWLADVSHRMQTPPDFPTVSALVIAGSIIGAGCSIKPKARDGWEVIPNIWGACIASPSMLKSPSMKEAVQLLERLQVEAGKVFDEEKKDFEFDNEVNQSTKKSLKAELDKATKKKVIDKTEIEVIRANFKELDGIQEPTRRLFKTNETSVQSMTVLQNENERGILVHRDELMGLLSKWDRDDGADERAYFLEGWNGNGSYTDFKIGRGLTDAKNICISLLGGIQPDKLKRYLYQALQGNNDGLMQRLQLAVWPDEPKSWQNVDTYPDKEAKQHAFDILAMLAEMDFNQYGAIKGEYDDRPYYRFTDTGQEVFNSWLTELQTVKIKQEENPLMAEHFGKFRSLMPSLALIFHLIETADSKAAGAVSEQAARLAVQWCDYLESHARRIYAMAESPEHEAAVRLADKIKAKALTSPFTSRFIQQKGWHGLKDKQEVDAACNILIDENWLRMARKPKPLTGRPPLPEYQINPVFL